MEKSNNNTMYANLAFQKKQQQHKQSKCDNNHSTSSHIYGEDETQTKPNRARSVQ